MLLKIASEKVKYCKVPEVHHVEVITPEQKKKKEKVSEISLFEIFNNVIFDVVISHITI